MALTRLLVLTSVAILTAAACGDSPTGPGSGLRIANLQATQLGLTHTLCGAPFQYIVHDELRFDVLGASNEGVVGATVRSVLDDGTETVLGVVTQCPANVIACQSPFDPPMNVCLAESGTINRIRVFARVAWTPVRTWRPFLRLGDVTTNVLEAQITRPDGLPTGNTAAIAFLEGRRTSATGGSFRFVFWSPGVAGRRITMTHEVWANGTRLSTFTREVPETQAGTDGTVGGITISQDPSELVGMIDERDANGNLIATDRKTTVFQ